MSDDIVGSCCSVAILGCYEVCLGICLDFMSVRHACTATLCSCRRRPSLEIDPSEREPLVQNTEPGAHPPMSKAPTD
ncbi:hypothetical protein BD309DRAFT_930995 [Dichomitus squalens]|uniref:Uncharacterized protein n=2 Tax=Dichomitus squalens TaxID=114155 RepID=A0A4Q9ND02_9APHY|nr:uncharacterized protein DICSQDRAFT_148499 [Dichomitus squalens LYAD-421 SS1]EJF59413.1 hypothetical protein DICSQDRAFT_148499 [Dichomitus squalens LYAD-421 SS1]TBU26706.1 hypothetical protein BD311DRAFT_762017 [Dichomitus squalens]TBU38265.1 hypothetical protein BD309DRAFT_930995 [Dichomitus squalens]TBU53322.1 hypothetical protein BD310DRAFT_938235 [Dichomitus squalens]